jgi:glycosyltransferase involved in cell wall biosynthesis
LLGRNVLVLEPYCGGSHRSFLAGLQKHLPCSFHCLTLPARKWKWRMRFAAPYFAGLLRATQRYDTVLCSAFVDVAALRGLGPRWLREVPVLTYFHENQFVYPVQVEHERDLHFAVTNLLSALASDRVAFNSEYNRESFLAGCADMVKRIPDMKADWVEELRGKATVLYPGVDFDDLDQTCRGGGAGCDEGPVIIWNHRWEHDKNPDFFFRTLFACNALPVDYRLVVLGQSFGQYPAIFDEIRAMLGPRLLHMGFEPDRGRYCRWLRRGTLVVSTAGHEFYGMSVLEAVRAGCRPLLPNRLSYPELFPAEFLYEDGNFAARLAAGLQQKRLDDAAARHLTERFSWPALARCYEEWLSR